MATVRFERAGHHPRSFQSLENFEPSIAFVSKNRRPWSRCKEQLMQHRKFPMGLPRWVAHSGWPRHHVQTAKGPLRSRSLPTETLVVYILRTATLVECPANKSLRLPYTSGWFRWNTWWWCYLPTWRLETLPAETRTATSCVADSRRDVWRAAFRCLRACVTWQHRQNVGWFLP